MLAKGYRVLNCEAISVNFGGVHALKEVNFAAEHGSVTALIGPNGAGKTTLLNVVSGLIAPDHGRVIFMGDDISYLTPHERGQRGIVRTFQNLEIFHNMTVLENVLTGYHRHMTYSLLDALFKTPSYWEGERTCLEYARQALDFVELLDKKDMLAIELPFGSQRLLELARAIVAEPAILLLDEPAAGLNPGERENLKRIIRQICDVRNIPVVLVEHDMELVMSLSDTVYVLNFGEVIATGEPREVQNNPDVITAYLGEEE